MRQQADTTTTGAGMIPEQLTDALAATPGADDWQCTVLCSEGMWRAGI